MQGNKIRGLTFNKLLGEGGFGKVYQVLNQKGEKFAAKKIHFHDMSDQNNCLKEAVNAASLEHTNVLKVVKSFYIEKQKCVVIVTELCEGGDLTKYIGKIDKNQCINFMKQIVDGVAYLHQEGLIHRDIKPQNILLNKDVPKLADFGLVRATKTGGVSTQIGTLAYLAPQVLITQQSDKPADIWALGITFIEMVLGKRIKQLSNNAVPGEQNSFPSFNLLKQIENAKMRELIKQMLIRDKQKRITIKQIKQTFQKQLNNKDLSNHNKEILIKKDQTRQITGYLNKTIKKIQSNTNQSKENSQIKIHISNTKKKLQSQIKTYLSDTIKVDNESDFLTLLENYSNFPNIQYLWLKSKNITDKGLTAFGKNSNKFPKIKQINLYQNKISNEGMIAFVNSIHRFDRLQKFQISTNQISDDGFIAFVNNGHKFPNLKSIHFSGNKISNSGMIALGNKSHNFFNLQSINLSSNKIQDEELTSFANNTNKFLNLKRILLLDNKISKIGLISFVNNSKKFPNLEAISLHGNEISQAMAKQIKKSFKIDYTINAG